MVGGAAQQYRRTLGALEVEVSIVFPGKADAAVELYRLARRQQEGVGRQCLGDGGGLAQRRGVFGGQFAGAIGRRTREFYFQQQVRQPMLDGLKAADDPPELDAQLGVGHRGVEQRLRAAHHLAGQCRQGFIHRPLQAGGGVPFLAEQQGLGARELHASQAACGVKAVERPHPHAAAVRAHRQQRQPFVRTACRSAGNHQDQIGHMAIQHIGLDAVNSPALVRSGRGDGGGGRIPLAVRFGKRQRGDQPAITQLRQPFVSRRWCGRVEQRVDCQHRRAQIGRADIGAPEFLHHDPQFDLAKTLAAERLGHLYTGQAKLAAQAVPQFSVKTAVAGHLSAHPADWRLLAAEARDDVAELLLLGGEGKRHGRRHFQFRTKPS